MKGLNDIFCKTQQFIVISIAHQQLMPQPQQQHFDIPVPQTLPGLVKYRSEPCRNPDCNMYGRPEQNGLCSKCFKLNKTERD